jgi:hypothetical protein
MPYNNPYNKNIAEQIDSINRRYIMHDDITGMGLSGGNLDTGYETPRSLDRIIGGQLELESPPDSPKNVMEGTTLVNTMAMPSSSMSGMGLSGGWAYKGQKKELKKEGKVYKEYKNKGVTPPQLKGWLAHVASIKSTNPGMKYKDLLALAKQSYKKAPLAPKKKIIVKKVGKGLSGGESLGVAEYKKPPMPHSEGKGLSGGAKVKKSNPWLAHVASVKASNPSMKYKDILVLAKESYKR